MASKERGGLSKREFEAKQRAAASKTIQTVQKKISTPKAKVSGGGSKLSDYSDVLKQRNQGDERAQYYDKQTIRNILDRGEIPVVPTSSALNISSRKADSPSNDGAGSGSGSSGGGSVGGGGTIKYTDTRLQTPDFNPKVDTKAAEKSAKAGEEKARARAAEADSFYKEFLDMKMAGVDRDYAASKEELSQTYSDLEQGLRTQKAETESEFGKLTSDLEVQRKEQKETFAKAAEDMKKGLEEDQKKLMNIFAARGTLHSSEFERVWADATNKFQDKLKELGTQESNQMLKIDNAFNRYTEERINKLNDIENKIQSSVKASALALAKLENEYRTRKDYSLADYKKDKLGVQAALDKQLYDIDQDKQRNIAELKKLATEQEKFRWQVQTDLADIAFKEGSLDLQRQRVNIEALKASQANDSGLPSGFYMSAKQRLNDARGEGDQKSDPQVFDELRAYAIDQGYGSEFDKQFFNEQYLSPTELNLRKTGGSSERFITLPDGTKIPY